MSLLVRGLDKSFGDTAALRDVDLDIAEEEALVVLGPTNAGKSTLLKTIAGVLQPDRGSIRWRGQPLDGLPPNRRQVSLLFQNNALFPHLTARENIAFPLVRTGMDTTAVERRVAEIAAVLDVAHLLDRHPRTFSGGEQQRVAIGRALARSGDLLLLDEPLTNIDARLRTRLRLLFKGWHAERRQTMVYVTHDDVEALTLATRIAVLDRGRVQQVGTPADIYDRPASRLVAELVGSPAINLLEVDLAGGAGTPPALRGDGFELTGDCFAVLADCDRLPRRALLAVRPEEVTVMSDHAEGAFRARVASTEHWGPRQVLHLTLGGRTLSATVPVAAAFAPGQGVSVAFAAKAHRLLDPGSGVFFR